MKRKEKNDLLKRMADALDRTLQVAANADSLPKDLGAEIVGILRECDESMPHFVGNDKRRYQKLVSDGKVDLTVEVDRS